MVDRIVQCSHQCGSLDLFRLEVLSIHSKHSVLRLSEVKQLSSFAIIVWRRISPEGVDFLTYGYIEAAL